MASSKWLQLSLVMVCYLVDSSFLQMPPLDKLDKLDELDKLDKLDKLDEANKFTSFQSAAGSQTDQDLDLLGSSDVKDLWKGEGVESERGNSEVDEERPWVDLSLYSDEDGDGREEGGDSEEVDEEESDEEENVDESEEETSKDDEEPSLRDITKFPVILKAPVTCHKFL